MKLSKAARKMIPVIIISSLILMSAGAVTFLCLARHLEALLFAVGVVFLAAFNIFKVYLIERAVRKTVFLSDADEARNYVRLQSLMRLGLTAAALLMAVLVFLSIDGMLDDSYKGLAFSFGEIGIAGACAGALTFHIAAFSLRFMKLYEDEEEGGQP